MQLIFPISKVTSVHTQDILLAALGTSFQYLARGRFQLLFKIQPYFQNTEYFKALEMSLSIKLLEYCCLGAVLNLIR